MYAVEFETYIDNGVVQIPTQYKKLQHSKKAKVIIMVEENEVANESYQSIKQLKGIAPKPQRVVSLEEMEAAIQLEGAKRWSV